MPIIRDAEGQQQRFDAAYAGLARRMRDMAVALGVPPLEAEEVVHDVFMTFLVQQPNVLDTERYLLAGTRRAVSNYWRKKGVERKHRGSMPDDPAGDVGLEERIASRTAVSVMLARLPLKCRETLRRFYIARQSGAQIAALLGTTEATVWQLLTSCRRSAREIYLAICSPIRHDKTSN